MPPFYKRTQKNRRIKIYRAAEADYVPIVSFNIDGMTSEKAASELAKEGFCLRAGFHCSALAHAQLGTDNGAVRFSPSVFSREDDAVRLAEIINKLTQ